MPSAIAEKRWRDEQKLKGMCTRCKNGIAEWHQTMCSDCKVSKKIIDRAYYLKKKQRLQGVI